jgi:hypothetical protein
MRTEARSFIPRQFDIRYSAGLRDSGVDQQARPVQYHKIPTTSQILTKIYVSLPSHQYQLKDFKTQSMNTTVANDGI